MCYFSFIRNFYIWINEDEEYYDYENDEDKKYYLYMKKQNLIIF